MNNTKLSLLLYFFCVFFSIRTENFDIYYFQKGLTISFEKTSVALAALQDTQDVEDIQHLTFNTLSTESLNAAIVQDEPKALVASGPRVFEKGITLDKTEILMVDRLERQKILNQIASNLNPQQVNRLMQVQDMDQILSEDWSQPSFQQEAKRIISGQRAVIDTFNDITEEEILLAATINQVASTSGPFNQLAIDLANKQKPTIVISSARASHSNSSSSYLPANLVAQNTSPASDRSNGFKDGLSGAHAKSLSPTEAPKAQVIKGSFELTQGMGFLFGQQHLEVIHQIDGVVYNKGFVNWTNASFEIPVHTLAGEIQALIYDNEGLVVGLGKIPLDGLPSESYELSGFHISLSPKHNGLHLQSISALSFEDYLEKVSGVYVGMPFEEALYKTDFEGKLENKLIKNGSSQNLQFKSKGQWTTTKYVEAGEKSQIPIFEDSMVSVVLDTLKEQGYNKGAQGNHGIVWGKIKNFKNAEGVRVEITDSAAYGPTYLNHIYLPQKSLQATTKNGYFIFAGVSPGIHSLSFNYQGKVFQRTIEVYRQNITYIDVEIDTVVEQKIAFVDFEEKPKQDIEIYIPGTKAEIAPTNPVSVKTIKTSAYNIIEFKEAREDIVYRVNLPMTKGFVTLRYLSANHLKKILNLDLASNAIIGFINPERVSGIFFNKKELPVEQMVYFDHESKIIPSSQLAIRWNHVAGFMIYNAPEGTQSLQIYDDKGFVFQHEVLVGNKVIHIVPEF